MQIVLINALAALRRLGASIGAVLATSVRAIDRASGRVVRARRANAHRLLAAMLLCAGGPTLAATLHHIQVDGVSGYTNFSCRSPVATVTACADSACSAKFTDGLSVTFKLQRAGGAVDGVGESYLPNGGTVVIPAGSSSATLEINANVPGSWTLQHVSSSPAYGYMYCNGYSGSSCPHSVAAETYNFAVAAPYTAPYGGYAHYSEVAWVNQSSCASYWPTVSPVPWELQCSYTNPSTGYVSPSAALTEPATGVVKRVQFNAANDYTKPCGGINYITIAQNSAANIWMRQWIYEDTGQVAITMTHRGTGKKVGFVATKTWNNVYLPSHFDFTSVPSGSIVAGSSFSMGIRAWAGSVIARSFGNEAGHVPPTIAFGRVTPTGTGASNGTATATVGSFANGYGTISNASWSEVGTGDFSVALTSMLGQPYITSYYVNNARGTTKVGAKSLGPFQPAELRAVATPGCGVFTYSGQPQMLTVEAVNASGTRTVNYDGTGTLTPKLAHALKGDVSFGGGTSTPSVDVTQASFINGLSSTTPALSFAALPQPPTGFSMALRSSTNDSTTGQPYVKTNTPVTGTLRQGRLAMGNAAATATAVAQIPLMAQYWTGSSWAKASDDGCTTLSASNFAPGSVTSTSGGAGSAVSIGALSFSSGEGYVSVNPPADGSSTVATIAANLGSGATSNTCSGVQPSATAAGKTHLRSRQSCATGVWTTDPSATVSFGVAQPRSASDVWMSDRR